MRLLGKALNVQAEIDSVEAIRELVTRGRWATIMPVSVFKDLRKNIDPEEYGSAYLLGVRGISMIGHGNTGTRGMANGILRAAQGVREDVTGHIQAGLTAAP